MRGNLIRALLIQVQKTKVDVEIAMGGIDSLLKSQELLIGFISLTPGLLVSHNERESNVLRAVREYLDPDRVALINIEEKIQSYSSSEVRQRIGTGEDTLWKGMVTEGVARYIETEQLYVPIRRPHYAEVEK